METAFSRTELLLGEDGVARLRAARVAVFGVGGVGGYAVEALARAGIGALDLVDNDVVSLSNLNRQIIATHDTLGQPKVDVAAARVHSINPDCIVRTHNVFFLPGTEDRFDFSAYDYIIDAIDTVSGKIALVLSAQAADTPILSCMGAGNKLDPTAFEITDIYKTTGCPLARVMRHELKKRGVRKLKVVFSREEAKKPIGSRSPGSVSFVPSVAGLIAAGEVIRELAQKESSL